MYDGGRVGGLGHNLEGVDSDRNGYDLNSEQRTQIQLDGNDVRCAEANGFCRGIIDTDISLAETAALAIVSIRSVRAKMY